jgi:hypothetical protein
MRLGGDDRDRRYDRNGCQGAGGEGGTRRAITTSTTVAKPHPAAKVTSIGHAYAAAAPAVATFSGKNGKVGRTSSTVSNPYSGDAEDWWRVTPSRVLLAGDPAGRALACWRDSLKTVTCPAV